ncbi:MAG: polysaccharide biosynthesis protein, partial [Frankiaceae bacterium]
RPRRPGRWPARRRLPAGVAGELGHAAAALLALLALSNVDVLLARHYLTARDAGLYAVGSVLAKGAFWAPQFIIVLLFPALAAGRRAPGVLRRGLSLVVGLGAVVTLGAAVLGRPVVRTLFGARYTGIAGIAWLFAALGATLAIAQLLLYSSLAVESRLAGLLVWLALAAEVVAIATIRHGSAAAIVSVALASAAAVVLASLVTQRSRSTGHAGAT